MSKILTLRLDETDHARLVLLAEERNLPVATLAAEVIADFTADPDELPPVRSALVESVEAAFGSPSGSPRERARRQMCLNLAEVASRGGVAAASATRQLDLLLVAVGKAEATIVDKAFAAFQLPTLLAMAPPPDQCPCEWAAYVRAARTILTAE